MNIALLIDCENAKAASIDGILGELAEKGTTNISRAYGNWKNQADWEGKLHPQAIQPIQQFALTKGKNAVDMCMAIDAMEMLFTEKIDIFAHVTGDSGTEMGTFTTSNQTLFRAGAWVRSSARNSLVSQGD